MKLYNTKFYRWLMRRLGLKVCCNHCPHWRFQKEIFLDTPGSKERRVHRVGFCDLDAPKLFNMNKLGFAFQVWFPDDWCPRHPLYVARPLDIPGTFGVRSDISYAPGQPGHELAGFNRPPTLDEALRISQGAHGNRDPRIRYQLLSTYKAPAPDPKENADNANDKV